ncbi:MAG TPA: M3 family oligoendopeptidase [Chitinophagaceae bacterium]|nr:M3 family oligoendopeptidase [Chitinophagaceae bacterium]
MIEASADIKKIERKFIPGNLIVENWEVIEPYFKELLERDINSKNDLEKWLADMNELDAIINEDFSWRQIRMTCDTTDKKLEESFNFFCMEIHPKMQPYADALNKKLVNSPFLKELNAATYFTYLRTVKKNIDLFREDNIQLQAELAVLQQKYGVITGRMVVEVNDKEYTLQQAAKFLESHDRDLREDVYRKINERRLQDKDELNDLFLTLIEKRQKVAQNAGFENYRDYKFKELGRFDYTKEDCFHFHDSVKNHVLPLVNKIYANKKRKLGLDNLRPWDVEAEPKGTKALTPFKTGSELLQKSIDCFTQIRPFFGDCLEQMNAKKHLDLESRQGKAPGGYNCPLAESGAPFIFMNAAGQMNDVTTMVHEGGHAVHSFLTHGLSLNAFKEYPMEIAEVASMAMELFSMDHWDVFFENKDDLRRAKEHQLERTISIFPWIAVIDKFQHWLYENPNHTTEERTKQWISILNSFSDEIIDYKDLENYRANGWQKQLHLFEVPFYYIEYGIAQLGAIGMWMQYKKNPEQALDNYMKALSLGGTKTLPELYKVAGLTFDFSAENIKALMEFVNEEMEKINK